MGHKILLADDSITVQKIVKLTFSDEGIEVIAVGNGEQAVQKLQDMRPDLVMADVFMPGKDGYEVCEYVKSHPDLRHTPVILLVHAFEPFDQEHAFRVGADQHLTKPFQSIRALVATVKDMIALPVSQAAYAAASPAPMPAPVPEPIATPSPIEAMTESMAEPMAESSFIMPATEAAFTPVETAPVFAAADIETNSLSVDSAPALPTFAPLTSEPFDTDTGFASVDTAPLAFPTQVDQGFGEVLESDTNDAPLATEPMASEPPSFEPESFLTPLALESPFTMQPESPAPLETEMPVNVAETEEPLSFDDVSAPDMNLSAEPVEILSVDHEADTAPLACATEELSEVLDLDNEPSAAQMPGDELELLPEIAATPQVSSEATATAEPAACEQAINESPICEPLSESFAEPLATEPFAEPFTEPFTKSFTEAPTATNFSAAPGHELPILAEVEMPVEMPSASFQPAAEFSTHTASSQAETPLFAETSEPGEVLEAAFTSTSSVLDDRNIGAGQVIETPPVSTEPPAAKQDINVGIETAPTPGFDLQNIPPALIDEIARRVVERLSEKAIQEIAWEVVPEMAELLIRQQLAEKVPH